MNWHLTASKLRCLLTARPNMKAKPAGFTRIELMALVAALTLVVALALPLVASTSTSAARLSCFNNLRQLGTAVLLFSNNHEDRPPWLTSVTNGGTLIP
ncbi:MAG TPA: hypothetical protein VK850_11760, partial [Candidatus Binatia bacterium]|nr:hypothetical protein [Candidatus Binatia bacterium]